MERRVPHRKPETFVAGDAFTEVGPHYVKNVNTATSGPSAKLLITQIVPKGTTDVPGGASGDGPPAAIRIRALIGKGATP